MKRSVIDMLEAASSWLPLSLAIRFSPDYLSIKPILQDGYNLN